MTQAIYPGTFDPITHGHTDLVQRASRLFERVVVAVAGSTWKSTTFTLEERMALVRLALDGTERVEVCSFGGLLVETAQSLGTTVILRGLRAVSDFEYEIQMASMNRRLVPEVDTLFLTPAEHYAYLSASLVREIASLGGDVSPFVHPAVASALAQKLRR